jgi:bis(5'-nucleosyl)-tetraphosphatase (symmetrical)
MSTYAIGDVQGCFDPLIQLLDKINFDPKNDKLWFTGDLVNRGTQSLKTIRFIKTLIEEGSALTILGNHDLGMLAIAREAEPFEPKKHSFGDILEAPDKEELLSFLEQQPLLHYDADLDFVLVHAGIHPAWDLTLALSLAKEVEDVLRSNQKYEFYHHLYGDIPNQWQPNLTGFDRIRFIMNCFVRMRFCNEEGKIDLITKESANFHLPGFMPWYNIPGRKNSDLKIIFGHWSTLRGKTDNPKAYALDTGCVWGNCLTAMRLEDTTRFSVACS